MERKEVDLIQDDPNESPRSEFTFSAGGVACPLVPVRQDVLGRIQTLLQEGTCARFIVAINPEKILRARKDPELREALSQSAANFADGVGVVMASRLLHGRRVERIAGVDLFETILRMLDEQHGSLFLFGATEETNQLCAEAIGRRHRGLTIVGRRSGYGFSPEEVLRQINAANPDLLAIALGSPLQERWILANIGSLRVKVAMGLGGSFDVLSGNVRRAPVVWRHVGMEWLWRLLSKPARIRRYVLLPTFAGVVMTQWLRNLGRRNAKG